MGGEDSQDTSPGHIICQLVDLHALSIDDTRNALVPTEHKGNNIQVPPYPARQARRELEQIGAYAHANELVLVLFLVSANLGHNVIGQGKGGIVAGFDGVHGKVGTIVPS